MTNWCEKSNFQHWWNGTQICARGLLNMELASLLTIRNREDCHLRGTWMLIESLSYSLLRANEQINTIFPWNWLETHSKAVANFDEYVLFCYNLKEQANDDFMRAVRQRNDIVWFGIPNGTHFWQPVDAGPGKAFKSHAKKEQNIALESYGWPKTLLKRPLYFDQ